MGCQHLRLSVLSGDCIACGTVARELIIKAQARITTLEAERDAAVEREADLRTELARVQEEKDAMNAARSALHALTDSAYVFATSLEMVHEYAGHGAFTSRATRESLAAFKAAYSRACETLGMGR